MSEFDPTPNEPLADDAEATTRTANYLAEMMPDVVTLAEESEDGTTFVEGQHEGQPFTIYVDTNNQTEEQ